MPGLLAYPIFARLSGCQLPVCQFARMRIPCRYLFQAALPTEVKPPQVGMEKVGNGEATESYCKSGPGRGSACAEAS